MVEYSVFSKLFNEQITERNKLVLSSMCNKIDEQLIFTESLIANISLNDEVNRIIRDVSLPLDAKKQYTLYQFVNDFNFGYMQIDYQSRIFIYFKHIDTVARASSFQSLESFCRTFIQNENAAESFKKIMNGENRGQYILMDFNGKKDELFYIKSVFGDEESSVVNIALHINKEAIARDISDLYLSDNGILAVLDENNRVLLEVRKSEEISETDIASLEKSSDMLSYKIKSSTTNWKYIYLLPKAEVYKKINHSKSLIIFFVLAVFFVCICIGISFFKSSYSRINDLVRLFKNEKKNVNEYSFLKEKIEHMLSENKRFSETLSSQNSYLKESVLTALLEEREFSGEYEKKEIEKLEFDFDNDFFSVVLFAFDYQKEENYPRAFAMENIFSELLERRGMRSHSLKYKNSLAYIIASDNDEILKDIMGDIEYAYDFVASNFDFGFWGAMGGKRRKRSGIAASFREAYHTLEFLTITNKAHIAQYDSVCALFKKNYFYTQKTEEKITNLIRVNDRGKLRSEIISIIKENGLLGSSCVNAARYFVLSAATTIENLLSENGADIEQVFPDECKFVNDIFDCNDAGKMREVVFSLFESCYDRVFANINPVLDLTDKIVDFIKDNYQNQMLSIQMIADEFERSNDYIARKFKAKMNVKINDYINIVRINEAKKYLSETNDLISAISEKVGFTNYRTFVRVFTNITGVSPKHYRDTNI